MERKKIEIEEFNTNAFTVLDKGMMLLTGGDADKSNSMTISWGSFGTFWFKPVVTVGIRPQRYTFDFVEENKNFTLCQLPKNYSDDVINIFGKQSGRNIDKVKECGLTLIDSSEVAAPAYDEAELIIECRVLYHADLDSSNINDPAIIERCYPNSDFHRLYTAEVVAIYGTDKYSKVNS